MQIFALEQEDAIFLKFILKSSFLKEVANLYKLSYPTVRLRLEELIQKNTMSDHEQEPFQIFIKGLAVDSRIDLDTANIKKGR